jgi:hypothetical protein
VKERVGGGMTLCKLEECILFWVLSLHVISHSLLSSSLAYLHQKSRNTSRCVFDIPMTQISPRERSFPFPSSISPIKLLPDTS